MHSALLTQSALCTMVEAGVDSQLVIGNIDSRGVIVGFLSRKLQDGPGGREAAEDKIGVTYYRYDKNNSKK